MEGKKYKVVETIGTLTRDRTSFGYQFSIKGLEVERLVENYDFAPDENKRVRVLVMIPESNDGRDTMGER